MNKQIIDFAFMRNNKIIKNISKIYMKYRVKLLLIMKLVTDRTFNLFQK